MSCSCNDKDVEVDFCHKPKVCDWKLDMVRKMIKCLCKCGDNPEDTPVEDSDCIATFLTGYQIDGFPGAITYSKNGGPFKTISIFEEEPNGLPTIINMLKNESLTGFAFTLVDSIYDNRDNLIEFCGLNSDGSFVASVYPDGFKPPELFMPNGIYPGPFNVIAEKNTLTFKATDLVPPYMDFFHCLNNPTGAETLTLESCAILEVLADPESMPPPPPILN